MIHSSAMPNDGFLDLLADAIASGNAPEGHESTAEIRGRFSETEVLEFEHAAAALACACAAADAERLPDGLRLRCAGAGRAVASAPSTESTPPKAQAPQAPAKPEPLRFVRHDSQSHGTQRRGVTLGWIAAAACLAIAATAWWPAGGSASATPDARMQALVETAPDLTRWDWNAWDPAYAEVTGEVVWSEAAQEGYMVLTGLPENDPSSEQYQLWVVDASRGTPLEVPPVDGGVFDVTEDGRVVIPVRCAIRAESVVAFAVTIEPPGGVVVSDRSRKAVIAQAPAPAASAEG